MKDRSTDQRALVPAPAQPAEPALERVQRQLRERADPTVVFPRSLFESPWSPAADVRRQARQSSIAARLDLFRDDLQSIRAARHAIGRAASAQAMEAAETAVFEIRSVGESTRFAILNRTHLDMTAQFLNRLEQIDGFRSRLSPELLDALRERALEEFTAAMNRASKIETRFDPPGPPKERR